MLDTFTLIANILLYIACGLIFMACTVIACWITLGVISNLRDWLARRNPNRKGSD